MPGFARCGVADRRMPSLPSGSCDPVSRLATPNPAGSWYEHENADPLLNVPLQLPAASRPVNSVDGTPLGADSPPGEATATVCASESDSTSTSHSPVQADVPEP